MGRGLSVKHGLGANRVDLERGLLNAASVQGLYHLLKIQEFKG